MNGDGKMLEQADTWIVALSGLGGAALSAIGLMVAGVVKSKGQKDVGMTQAQAQMLTDAWAQVNAQRERIEMLDKKIHDERRECDRQLEELRMQVHQLQQRIEE